MAVATKKKAVKKKTANKNVPENVKVRTSISYSIDFPLKGKEQYDSFRQRSGNATLIDDGKNVKFTVSCQNIKIPLNVLKNIPEAVDEYVVIREPIKTPKKIAGITPAAGVVDKPPLFKFNAKTTSGYNASHDVFVDKTDQNEYLLMYGGSAHNGPSGAEYSAKINIDVFKKLIDESTKKYKVVIEEA